MALAACIGSKSSPKPGGATTAQLTPAAFAIAARANVCETAITVTTGSVPLSTSPRKSPTSQARLAVSAKAADGTEKLLGDGSRRGDRVELVRVIEDRRLGRSRCPHVVMAGDGVQELRPRWRVERVRPLLD